MDFELSEEVRQIRDTFARYVDERLVPHAADIDEAHAFPREAFDEIGALGFFLGALLADLDIEVLEGIPTSSATTTLKRDCLSPRSTAR